jgi:HK97 family phage prohead protease
MSDVYQYKDCDVAEQLPLAIKDVDGKKGIVTGYFANFNTIDSDGDIIKPGAFVKTINETGPLSRKPRIKHILNHNPSQPLGVLQELKEDGFGLYYESKVGTHTLGQDFIKMIESGIITEHSIGYRTIKFNQLKPWTEWKEGEAMRELTELRLWEGSSLTAWGANSNTPLTGMKAMQKADAMSKRINLLIKALRNGEFSDETFDMLEIELKQIEQSFIDLTKEVKQPPESTVEPVIEATQPKVVKSRNWTEITQLLN